MPEASPCQTLSIPVGADGTQTTAELCLPPDARGLILFAHGSGSNRMSPRNRRVAELLQRSGFATLLVDLVAPGEEARTGMGERLRSHVPFLAERLITLTHWIERQGRLGQLPRGLLGSYTGAAAALVAAALRPDGVRAVVCRGGRPDLAGDALADVLAPVLFIVGGEDHPLLELNQQAKGQLCCDSRLEIVPGAQHLFEEPGALDQVAELAREWFSRHLLGVQTSAQPHPT